MREWWVWRDGGIEVRKKWRGWRDGGIGVMVGLMKLNYWKDRGFREMVRYERWEGL